MKLIEKFKLQIRARKYRKKNDVGGVDYMLSVIKPGQTLLDIGSHKAGYLYWMRKCVGKEGEIYAFEPQTLLYKYICRIIQYFEWKNVIVEHLALSDKIGKTTLYIPVNEVNKQSSPEASLLKPTENKKINKTETVSIQTLDNYCSIHSIQPEFLKIDVEGNELNVLKGGEEILKRFKPKILVEIEVRHAGIENAKKTFRLLESIGYTGHFICGANRYPLEKFDFDKHQNRNDLHNYCNNFTFEFF